MEMILLNKPLKSLRFAFITAIVTLSASNVLISQNTIGTTLNSEQSLNGYTLITPNSDVIPSTTYLIDNCGNVVNSWASPFKGQGADVIMEDGSLYRGAFDDQSTLDYAGNNGRLEHYDWDGNLLWGLTYSDTDFSFHHDYTVLDNGNILMIVAQRMSSEEALQAGRNPNNLIQGDLYTEKIIEITPIGEDDFSIVWEWDVWNHLVQDFDSSLDNFGVVSDHPDKLNINFIGFSNDKADWLHLNSIDYNAELDQILISARFTSEIYIIDHSTTTEEAASDTGGNSGKGGRILYRWGNPQAYDRGTQEDQLFFGQHTAHWIEEGLPNEGDIMVFNNGFMRGYTTIDKITPPLQEENGNYPISTSQPFEPVTSDILYQTEPLTDFFAPFLSSAYTLTNGNILINDGPVGQLREVHLETQEIVWEYISPVTLTDGTLSQGDPPAEILSRFFRAVKYAPDYIGFADRDLTPGPPIELNPSEDCSLNLSITTNENLNVRLYPNPATANLFIDTKTKNFSYSIYNLAGQLIHEGTTREINVNNFNTGIYLVKVQMDDTISFSKFVKN